MKNKFTSKRISILALFLAVIVIQNYVPLLGYIPIGPLDVTTIHITVIVSALVVGPVDGAIVGGMWGLIEWGRAITLTSSPLGNIVMVNPIVSILPRILIGLLVGHLFRSLVKFSINKHFAMIISAICGSLINTILVLSFIYIFYHNGSNIYHALNLKVLMPYLLGVAGANGIPEAIAAGIIAPIISIPLFKFNFDSK